MAKQIVTALAEVKMFKDLTVGARFHFVGKITPDFKARMMTLSVDERLSEKVSQTRFVLVGETREYKQNPSVAVFEPMVVKSIKDVLGMFPKGTPARDAADAMDCPRNLRPGQPCCCPDCN